MNSDTTTRLIDNNQYFHYKLSESNIKYNNQSKNTNGNLILEFLDITTGSLR